MSLFYSLFALFISVLLSWLCLFLFFNLPDVGRIILSVFFGVCIFQLANYFYIGYVDPFIVLAVVISFVFSLVFVIFLEVFLCCFLDRKIRKQTMNELNQGDTESGK
jgi:hypothetical protein